mgnify:CR=1 FL=1
MKYIELAKKLKEGIERVYLIEGDDAFFRDGAVKAIKEACNLTQPLLNESCTEGETLKGDGLTAFIGSLYTAPMFDELRFVRVNSLFLGEREWERFKGYCEKPCPSTVLVLVNAVKKQDAVDLKRKGGITYVDCSRESEETLTRWLFTLMRREGLVPEQDAVSFMVRCCTQDAARMKSETLKLKSILGEGGRVTRAVVEEYVPKDAEYKIYELTQAASRKNFDAFTDILTDLTVKGFDEIAVLSSLCSHYRTLAEIASSNLSDKELAETLGVKPYAVGKNREAVARLGAKRVCELYRKLYALSCGGKSGVYHKSGALTAAIANIFFG